MATKILDGNLEYTVGSTEPIFSQIFKKKGVTPEPLPNITGLTIHLRNVAGGAVESFTFPKITVDDEDTGLIKHEFAADDFANIDAEYFYHYSFTDDAAEKHKVPTDTERYKFIVFRNHES